MRGKKRARGDCISIIVFFLFAVASIIFGIICLSRLRAEWIIRNIKVCVSLYSLFILSLYTLSAWMVYKGKRRGVRALITVFLVLLFCLILWWIFQKTGFFKVFGDSELLQEYLQKAGIWMPILYVTLQFLQVVILPIPSIVSTVAGIALFGAFWTAVYSFVGIVLGSILAFYIGKRWGNRAVGWLIGEESLKSWQKKLKGKDNALLTVMFLLPVFPDDILCFFAGISTMSWRYFLVMMGFSRFIAITSTCYSFDLIPVNTWWGILLWLVIIGGIIAITILVYKNMDRIQAKIKGMKRPKKN